MSTIEDFKSKLNELDPMKDEFVIEVDKLIEALPESSLLHIYPTVFRFFEKYQEADCGAPGALVHVVESFYPNYLKELKESVIRTPSYNGTLMINRILNSEIENEERTELLNILEQTKLKESTPRSVVELVDGFLIHQNRKGANKL